MILSIIEINTGLAGYLGCVVQEQSVFLPSSFSLPPSLTMETTSEQPKKSFAPKDPPKLNPPRDDPISPEDLAKCDGNHHHIHNPLCKAKALLIWSQSVNQAPTRRIRPGSPSWAQSSMYLATQPTHPGPRITVGARFFISTPNPRSSVPKGTGHLLIFVH